MGAALQREWLAAGEQVVGLSRQSLDLLDLGALATTLSSLEFDVLVNCAAQTNVDRCETHPDEARLINSEAVGVIARVCSEKRARCIHISTDYVFDGEKREPYTEDDVAQPISVYGGSKRAGEKALLAVSGDHLAVRVSWVFGPDRPSFIDQILQRAVHDDQAAAVSDKWAVPSYTLDLAAHLMPLLSDIKCGGLLHLCNGGECTWQEYGQYALDCAKAAGVTLKTETVAPMVMSDIKAFIARRPRYTVMSTEKYTRFAGVTPRTWQAAVQSYISDIWAPLQAKLTRAFV